MPKSENKKKLVHVI